MTKLKKKFPTITIPSQLQKNSEITHSPYHAITKFRVTQIIHSRHAEQKQLQ